MRTRTIYSAPRGQSFPGVGRRLNGSRFTRSNMAAAAGVASGLYTAAKKWMPVVTGKSKRGMHTSGGGGIKTGRIVNEGTGGQCSYFTGKKGKCYLPKHVENALPPQVFTDAFSSQLKSAVGLQNVSLPLTLQPPNIATTFTSDKISRVLYQKATGDVTLNNIFLSNAYIIIYDIVARKDIALSSVGTPLSAWIQGDVDETATSVYTLLGSTPWQAELFNQYYKVMQQTNVVLGAGATHVHKVRLSPNKVISSAYSTYTPFAFKDVTYFCMIEVHGSPANDTVTQTQVSIGVGGLNIIADREHTLKQLANAKPTIVTGSALLTSFTIAEQVVNLGGSTIVTQAEG